MSISKLTADNTVYVEFHQNLCVIKEKRTWNELLRVVLDNRLYLMSHSSQKHQSQCQTQCHPSRSIPQSLSVVQIDTNVESQCSFVCHDVHNVVEQNGNACTHTCNNFNLASDKW